VAGKRCLITILLSLLRTEYGFASLNEGHENCCRFIHIVNFLIDFLFFQAMTPHMQTPAEDLSTLKDQQHGNFSIDIWKSVFLDAFSRICPLRAGGHECGCLPALAKLVCFEMGVIFLF
jgi:hypothetical protein